MYSNFHTISRALCVRGQRVVDDSVDLIDVDPNPELQPTHNRRSMLLAAFGNHIRLLPTMEKEVSME